MDTFEMDVWNMWEISFLIAFYYTTNRNNKAIPLKNFVYYLKKENANGTTGILSPSFV